MTADPPVIGHDTEAFIESVRRRALETPQLDAPAVAAALGLTLPDADALRLDNTPDRHRDTVRLFAALAGRLGQYGYDVGGLLADARWTQLVEALRLVLTKHGNPPEEIEARAVASIIPELVRMVGELDDAQRAADAVSGLVVAHAMPHGPGPTRVGG